MFTPVFRQQKRPWRGAGPFSPEEEAGRAVAHMQRRRGRETAPPPGVAMTSPVRPRLNDMPSLGIGVAASLEAKQCNEQRQRAAEAVQRHQRLQGGADPRAPDATVKGRSTTPHTQFGPGFGSAGRRRHGASDSVGGVSSSPSNAKILTAQAVAAGQHDDRGSWLPRETARAVALGKSLIQAEKFARETAVDPAPHRAGAAARAVLPRYMQVMQQLSMAKLGLDVTTGGARGADSGGGGVGVHRAAGHVGGGGRTAVAEVLAAKEAQRERDRVAQGVDWLRESLSSFYPEWLRQRPDFQPLLRLREDSARTAALEIMQAASEAGLKATLPTQAASAIAVDGGEVSRSAATATAELAAQSRRSVAALAKACEAAPSQRRTLDTLVIAKTLARMPCCVGMTGDEVRAVAGAVYLARAVPGEPVYEQGDVAHSFYVLLEGTARVAVDPIGSVHTLRPGEWFGEAALVQNEARESTVTAETACNVMVLTREDFAKAMKKSETRHMLRNIDFLQKLPFFTGWSRPRLSRLAAVFAEVRVPAGRVLARQGERCSHVFVLMDGSLGLWHTATVEGTNRWPTAVYHRVQTAAAADAADAVDEAAQALQSPPEGPGAAAAMEHAAVASRATWGGSFAALDDAGEAGEAGEAGDASEAGEAGCATITGPHGGPTPPPPPRRAAAVLFPTATAPSRVRGAAHRPEDPLPRPPFNSSSPPPPPLPPPPPPLPPTGSSPTAPRRQSPAPAGRDNAPGRQVRSGSPTARRRYRQRVGVERAERRVRLRRTEQVGQARPGALYGLHFVCRGEVHPFTVRAATAVRVLTGHASLFRDNAANTAAAESFARRGMPAIFSAPRLGPASDAVVAHGVELLPHAATVWAAQAPGGSAGSAGGPASRASHRAGSSGPGAMPVSSPVSSSAEQDLGRGGRRQSTSRSRLQAAEHARMRRQSDQGMALLRQRRASVDVLRSMTAEEAAMMLRRTLFGLELAQRERREALRDHRGGGGLLGGSPTASAAPSRGQAGLARRSRRGSVGFRARPFGVDEAGVAVVAAAKARSLVKLRR